MVFVNEFRILLYLNFHYYNRGFFNQAILISDIYMTYMKRKEESLILFYFIFLGFSLFLIGVELLYNVVLIYAI